VSSQKIRRVLLMAVWAFVVATATGVQWCVSHTRAKDTTNLSDEKAAEYRRIEVIGCVDRPNEDRIAQLVELLDGYPELLETQTPTSGMTLVHYAAENNLSETIRALAQRGAKLDRLTLDGLAPLHIAAQKNAANAAEALLELKADINQLTIPPRKQEHPRTPLDVASQYGCESVVEVLFKNHAKLDGQSSQQSYPAIHFAMQGSWTLRVDRVKERRELFMQGVKPFTMDPGPLPEDGNAKVIGQLIDAGADLKSRNHNGDQPLHVAIANNQIETVRLLVTRYKDRIDINGRGHETKTPLMTAVCVVSPRNAAVRQRIVELLLENGADKSIGQFDEPIGATAYDLAVRLGVPPSITQLLAP
jgi:ankyrin repeat protein